MITAGSPTLDVGALVQAKAGQQKVGGLAALYMAMAYLVAMPFFRLGVVMMRTTERRSEQIAPGVELAQTLA